MIRKGDTVKADKPCQLHETVLENPCFQIFGLAESHGNSHPKFNNINSPHSFQEQFYKRLVRGQSFTTTALGRKEFLADYVGLLRPDTQIMTQYSSTLPSMLYRCFSETGKINFESRQNVEIVQGVITWQPGIVEIRDGKLDFINPVYQQQIKRLIEKFSKKAVA